MFELIQLFQLFNFFKGIGGGFSFSLLLFELNYLGLFIGAGLGFLLRPFCYSLLASRGKRKKGAGLKAFEQQKKTFLNGARSVYELVRALLIASFGALAVKVESGGVFVFLCVLLGVLSLYNAPNKPSSSPQSQKKFSLSLSDLISETACTSLTASSIWFLAF